jgi:two-component system phosphate regulon response regulator OmpR
MPAPATTGIKRLPGIADIATQLVTVFGAHLLPSFAPLLPRFTHLFTLFGRHFTHLFAHRHMHTPPELPGWRRILRGHRVRSGSQATQQKNGGMLFHARILGCGLEQSPARFVTILCECTYRQHLAMSRNLSSPFGSILSSMNTETRKPKILVVDDDVRLRSQLERYLAEQGFTVKTVADGAGMDRALERELYDLIVLDLMLPGEDGLSICRRLRGSAGAQNAVAILMLTAKGDDIDRIVGLELGADDYLPKPFNPRELLARVHAVLRRRPTPEVPAAPSTENEVARFGPFVFDLAARTLHKEGQELMLTSGEFAMLKALVRHPRVPLSREKLAQLSRGREFEPFDRSLDVQVSRLRKLIESDPAQPRIIQTVWGVGYVFVPDDAT